jgi:hypothetical protein
MAALNADVVALPQEQAMMLIRKITGMNPQSVEINVLGSGWYFYETYDGNAYWLHVPSRKLLDSTRNLGSKRNG